MPGGRATIPTSCSPGLDFLFLQVLFSLPLTWAVALCVALPCLDFTVPWPPLSCGSKIQPGHFWVQIDRFGHFLLKILIVIILYHQGLGKDRLFLGFWQNKNEHLIYKETVPLTAAPPIHSHPKAYKTWPHWAQMTDFLRTWSCGELPGGPPPMAKVMRTYTKAGWGLRSPPGNSRASTPITRACLLYYFVLSPSPLSLRGAVPHHLFQRRS